MRTFRCSENNCKNICGTFANLGFHYQTFYRGQVGKKVNVYVAINNQWCLC